MLCKRWITGVLEYWGWGASIHSPITPVLHLKYYQRYSFAISLFVLIIFHNPCFPQGEIIKPHKFIGYKIGADKKLFGWQQVVDYFMHLSEVSENVVVEELGKSTAGKPFIMAIISAPLNIKNLAKYKNLQKQAANPANLSEEDAELLARENKNVVMIILNSGSQGIASSQGVIELAYRLASGENELINDILKNVILLLIPQLNPDGMQKMVDWYNNYLGTPHEACPLPNITHSYAGDELTADWLTLNLSETGLVINQLYQEWYPEIVCLMDESYLQNPRFVVKTSPNPFVDDLREKVINSNLEGVTFESGDLIAGDQNEVLQTALLHNQIPLHFSTASVLYASPLFFPIGSYATEHFSSGVTKSWPVGWWHLRDAVEYQIAFAKTLLAFAADNKKEIIRNFCLKNLEFIHTGSQTAPAAFLIQNENQDKAALKHFIHILKKMSVAVYVQNSPFPVNGSGHGHDYIVPLNQSFQPLIQELFAKENQYGSLRLKMGINNVIPVEHFDESQAMELKHTPEFKPQYDFDRDNGCFLSNNSNDVFLAVNRILVDNKRIYWLMDAIPTDDKKFAAGTFYIPAKELEPDFFKQIIAGLNVEIYTANYDLSSKKAYKLRQFKLGLFQPWTANHDEGWTRLVLEKHEFKYLSVFSPQIRNNSFAKQVDVLLIPDMTEEQIVNGWWKSTPDISIPKVPRSYLAGISETGVRNLKEFVEKGGTLITLGKSCSLVIQQFGLPVQNVVEKISDREKLVELNLNRIHPVTYGLAEKPFAVLTDGPVFLPKFWPEQTNVIAHLNADSLLNNADIKLVEHTTNLSAILEFAIGRGKVILISVRPQYQAQTDATFRILFNAIYYATAENITL